jgi:hypothetical protein
MNFIIGKIIDEFQDFGFTFDYINFLFEVSSEMFVVLRRPQQVEKSCPDKRKEDQMKMVQADQN